MRYRLRSAINTLHATDRSLKILIVPRDSVVEVCGDEYSSGMVNLRYGGFVVAAFIDDLKARGEQLALA